MYALVLSDDSSLPIELCLTIASLGHAAGVSSFADFQCHGGPKPGLIVLDLAETADVPQATQAVRHFFPESHLVLLGCNARSKAAVSEQDRAESLPKPLEVSALRNVLQRAAAAA